MPFGSMTRPSLALGLLKSQLAAIDARVENFARGCVYSNFAQTVCFS